MKKLLLVIPLLLAGCVTTYGPYGLTGGYSESMRGDNVYVILFEGNGFTRPVQVEEMAMLRAAELTLAKGANYFTILNESAGSTNIAITTPGTTRTTGQVNAYGNFSARTVSTPAITQNVSAPSARFVIAMATDNTAPGQMWIDAKKVVAELGPKYQKK